VPIFQTAHYRVRAEAVEKVRSAIVEFVATVAKDEPGTTMYRAWQQESDPTAFVHLFEFADEEAHRTHGNTDAVAKFESVYRPELVDGPVVFTDYGQVATNRT